MAIRKLQLQPISNESDYSKITIGDSKFTDDTWDLSSFITSKNIKDSHKIINFSYIKNEDIQFTTKRYAYYRLGKVQPSTVRDNINGHLPSFIDYCSLKSIYSFSEITKEIFLNYAIWLKEVKKVSQGTGYINCFVVEDIIKKGQMKEWNVPKGNILHDVKSIDLWEPQKNRKEKKTKPIPEGIFDKILSCTVNKETDILTKAGIIIQSQTGLRISEVLSIQVGCCKTTSDGNDYIEVTIRKTEKEEVIHKVFLNHLVKDVIKELEEYTKELRQESGLKELFLSRSRKFKNEIVIYKGDKFNELKLPKFIKRWDIRDNKGDLYPLNSHQFRATFVRELIKQKVPIAHVMKQFRHVSVEMTSHYLTLDDDEVKEIYSDIILNPESKIAGLRAKEIKEKLNVKFKGKTREEIDDAISDLAATMSFNPLPTGVCLFDARRGNCSNGSDGCFIYNCANYITEVQFYPILKNELDLMEAEMKRLKELGQERAWQIHHVKHKYLKPLVESLEVQINDQEKAQ